MSKQIKSFKGFDKDLKCRDFQYEVGKTYEHEGGVEACSSGFHACEHPFDVFSYYEPSKSRYAVVTQSGETSKDGDDSKVSSAKITIEAELCLSEFIERGVELIISKCSKLKTKYSKKGKGLASNSGTRGAASNSGDSGAASNSGDSGAASNSGDSGAASNSGTRGAASNSGDSGAASNSGYYGAASNSGYYGAASNSGTRGAASNSGTRGAASNSGYYGAASNSGDYGAASNSGDYGAASNSGTRGAASNSGYSGAAMNAAYKGQVKGVDGTAMFLVERNDSFEVINVWSGIVGKGGVKADVWYTLTNGELVEAQA